MKPSFNKTLFTGAVALAVAVAAVWPAAAIERPRTIITEPYDQNPNAITRPAGRADREWRRGRGTPQIRMTPQTRVTPREPPRYDSRGRRLNVPGRPDTYDAVGRARQLRARRAPAVTTTPTVQTDVGTRINQLAPR